MSTGLVAYWLLFAGLFLVIGSFDTNDPKVNRARPWNWAMPLFFCALVVGVVLTLIALARSYAP